MNNAEFKNHTVKILKFNRRRNRWVVNPSCVGYQSCDLCQRQVQNPGWDLVPWHPERKYSATCKITCRICFHTKQIPFLRSE